MANSAVLEPPLIQPGPVATTARFRRRAPAAPAGAAAPVVRNVRRLIVVVYLLFLAVLPLTLVLWRTFEHGFGPVADALSDPDLSHAFVVTAQVAAIAVAVDVVFGVGVSLLLARRHFPGRRLLSTLVDLPLAVSPVVVGLALILVYGRYGWFGFVDAAGFKIIFAVPGMALATVFVSLPLVVREVVPVLTEVGTEQEEAARTLGAGPWQTFRRVTLPSIKWALVYGIVLSLTRAIGEYGAVAVVAGNQNGMTQTVTLVVQQKYENFQPEVAYTAAFVLAMVAVVSLVAITVIRARQERR